MKTQHEPCDPTIIQRSVDRRLSENGERDFEAHLSECDSCRELLQSQIADDSFWVGLGAHLRDSEYELSPLSSVGSTIGADTGRDDVQRVLNVLAPTVLGKRALTTRAKSRSTWSMTNSAGHGTRTEKHKEKRAHRECPN